MQRRDSARAGSRVGISRRTSARRGGNGTNSVTDAFNDMDVASGVVTTEPNRRASTASTTTNTAAAPTSAPVSSSSNGAALPAPPAPPSAPTLDAKFSRYVQMRKILPEMALRHKMAGDGFSESDIDYFMDSTNPDGPSVGGSASPASAASRPTAAPGARPVSEPVASTGTLPPKPTGAFASVLGDISKRRIE